MASMGVGYTYRYRQIYLCKYGMTNERLYKVHTIVDTPEDHDDKMLCIRDEYTRDTCIAITGEERSPFSSFKIIHDTREDSQTRF